MNKERIKHCNDAGENKGTDCDEREKEDEMIMSWRDNKIR